MNIDIDKAIAAVVKEGEEQQERWKSLAEEQYVLDAIANAFLHAEMVLRRLKK